MKKGILFPILLIVVLGLLVACKADSGGDSSEDYPKETIDIIAAFAAGGSNDIIARTLAEHAEDEIGQSIIVENKTGGSGSVGQAAGASAKPDGYTLTLVTPSIVSNPLFNDLPYTYDSFKPVILINNDPQYLVINADSDFESVEDFIEYAKENPGELKVGVSGANTTNAFASQDLAKELDIDIVTVPHDGTSDSIVALQGNHIDAVVASYAEFQGQMKNDELEPILNFAGTERNDNTPDVPTALELDIDVDYSSWRGIAVPADTDDEVIEILHDKFKKVIETDEFQASLENIGLDIDYLNTEDFQKLMDETHENYLQFTE